MRRLSLLCLALPASLAAAPAGAVDMEFYTYNGFEPVTSAFRRVALIFGSGDLEHAFGLVCSCAILFAGAAWYARYVTGLRAGPFHWGWPILTGALLYLGLFVPTGSLTVYDPVKNRFERIEGIPDAVVLTTGALNQIQRAIVDLVDTTAPAGVGYKDGAGGLGFYAVQETLLKGARDTDLTQNLDEYIRKCVSFELQRPGTALRIEDLVNASSDFTAQLGLAASPAVWCLHFDPEHPRGLPLTCQAAWSDPNRGLRAWFARGSNYAPEMERAAATTGFDPENAAERARYRALVTATVREHLGLAGITPERVSQQGTIARQLFEFIKDGSPAVAAALRANPGIATGLFGAWAAANQWIPIVQAGCTAVVIGMIPFLAIFLPTPFFKRVFQVFVGLFFFLAAWGATDAVAHSFALEYADHYFETVRQSGLSLATWLNLPDANAKMFSLLGFLRSTGAVLAGVFGVAVGLETPALASLASHVTAPVLEHGAAAGRAALTPSGRADALQTLTAAEATNRVWDNGGRFTAGAVVRGRMQGMHADLGASLGYDTPADAFHTGFIGTRIRTGQVAGTSAGAATMGYGVRGGMARVAAASTIGGIARDEAHEAEAGLDSGRAAFERGVAGVHAARAGGDVSGVAVAGGTSALRASAAKHTAWGVGSQETLGKTPEEAADRARRRGTVDRASDEAAFAWRDGTGISDAEFGRRTGRLRAQEAFYGALAIQRTAGRLHMTDDRLVQGSTEYGAARRAGDARAAETWGVERIARAQAFGAQHEILREQEKRGIARALGIPLEDIQAMGYRTGHGVLTPQMAAVINDQLAAAGRSERVAAGQVANWVMDSDYNVAFVDTTRGVQTSDLDTASRRKGVTVRDGDNIDVGDFERNQDVLEWTDDTGHHVRQKSALTGELGVETVRRGVFKDEATGRGASYLVLTPQGVPVWSSTQAGDDRRYFANRLLWVEGPEVTGNIIAGKLAEEVGEQNVVEGLRMKKAAEEGVGIIELPARAIRAGKSMRR